MKPTPDFADQKTASGTSAKVRAKRTLHGSCHCGQLRIEFTTTLDPATTNPRACDCSFCVKHGAAWVSDPSGKLSVSVQHADTLREYRQGSETARFLVCANCGVLVAVVFDHHARTYGAVNITCMDGDDAFAPSVCASPQKLNPEEKVSRWAQLWIADVVFPPQSER